MLSKSEGFEVYQEPVLIKVIEVDPKQFDLDFPQINDLIKNETFGQNQITMCDQILFIEDDRQIIPILDINLNYETSEFFDVKLSLKDLSTDEIIST